MADTPWDDEVRPLPSKEQAERFKGVAQSADIVERLKNATVRYASESQEEATVRRNAAIKDARDTIESLREEVRKLRDATALYAEGADHALVRDENNESEILALREEVERLRGALKGILPSDIMEPIYNNQERPITIVITADGVQMVRAALGD